MAEENEFSMNWQMVDGFGGNVQITMRAGELAGWAAVMGVRKEFCEKAQQSGWTFPGVVKVQAAPAPLPANTTATPAPAPMGATSTTAPANGNGVLSVTSSELRVTPRTDGKVDLAFWNAGRKYEEIKATKSPDDAIRLLAPTGVWTKDNFTAVGTFGLPVSIEYRLSDKRNSKGNPYKDILKITRLAA